MSKSIFITGIQHHSCPLPILLLCAYIGRLWAMLPNDVPERSFVLLLLCRHIKGSLCWTELQCSLYLLVSSCACPDNMADLKH